MPFLHDGIFVLYWDEIMKGEKAILKTLFEDNLFLDYIECSYHDYNVYSFLDRLKCQKSPSKRLINWCF